MASWLSTVRMLVQWTCECGNYQQVNALETHEHVCSACGRVWRINGRLNISYEDAPKAPAQEEGSLWRTA